MNVEAHAARQGLTQSQLQTGAVVDAGQQLEETIRSNPRDINSIDRLAWLPATAATELARDGEQSLKPAR